MEQTQLLELMYEFDKSGLAKLVWEQDGNKIKLEKAVAGTVQAAPSLSAAAPVVAAVVEPAATDNRVAVKAPLVGVLYMSSAPGAAPYVQQGQRVAKGQVMCLIEAMKMMSELTSPVDGTVARVCAANEEVVSFDQILFEVAPC